MIRSTLLRAGALVTSVAAAPLALAQQAATPPPHWSFIAVMGGLGMLMVLGILAIVSFTDSRKTRDKLALVERLVTGGQPVPRELMVNEPRQLTLPEELRRDVRRGIAQLCWAVAIGLVFYFTSGGQLRAASWGLLLLVPALGNFLKAWLTARDIARGSADGAR